MLVAVAQESWRADGGPKVNSKLWLIPLNHKTNSDVKIQTMVHTSV
jgi:hypothetical protein